ncbi:acetyl-CoA C-acetyltransferase [Sodalis sp. RH21]|uniref:acetyl-CoA C-acetyltransferase n=1 Tax=unclassified Sodalis (in: enterobacteria) TaxID=2636512 RepID=UPI0039B5EA91
MTGIVIASAVRTPIGSFGGGLASLAAPRLGALVARESIRRAGIPSDIIGEVFLGNVLQAGLGQNPARQAMLHAGIDEKTPAATVNVVCGSGLKSVILASQVIAAGDAQIVLAGGMENMSAAPYLLDKARWGYRMGEGTLTDSMVHDGLFCSVNQYHMGITAENVAARHNISRQEQDNIALRSQRRAVAAIDDGAFRKEILPVILHGKKGDIIFDTDEYPRRDASAEGLASLRPAFTPEGSVTAGNASGINDGAAALVVMSEARACSLGIRPLARIRGYATCGVDPAFMGIGPVPAVRAALKKAGLGIGDIDLIEANEAFAAQFAAVGHELGLDEDKTNVNGGAIALGHPIGASGARILVTLLYALAARDKTFGLATLCVGGGLGVAVVVERL